MNSLVTICIPVYNGQKYLDDCISSAISQTFENTEILLIDDCSNDDSLQIIGKYLQLDKRIKLIKNDYNLGLVRNWNKCIDYAQGEYVKFLFQDDYMENDCVEKMLNVAVMNHASFVICSRKYIFENSLNSSTIKFYNDHVFKLNSEIKNNCVLDKNTLLDLAQHKLIENFIGEPIILFFKRNIIDKVGEFNPNFLMLVDYEFILRASLNSNVYFIPEELVTFRVHNESETSRSNENSEKLIKIQLVELVLLFHEYLFNPKFKALRKKKGRYSLIRFFISVYRSRAKLFDHRIRIEVIQKYYMHFNRLKLMVKIAELTLKIKPEIKKS